MVDEIIVGFEDAIREPIVAHERQTFSTELTSGHFGGAQLPAERLLGDGDPKLLENPLGRIDQPPAHHAMDRSDRAIVDHAGDGLALGVIELGRLVRRLAVQQPVTAARVEPQHPQSRMI